jgi:hypothetical protein
MHGIYSIKSYIWSLLCLRMPVLFAGTTVCLTVCLPVCLSVCLPACVLSHCAWLNSCSTNIWRRRLPHEICPPILARLRTVRNGAYNSLRHSPPDPTRQRSNYVIAPHWFANVPKWQASSRYWVILKRWKTLSLVRSEELHVRKQK